MAGQDGRRLSPLLWPQRPQQDGRGMPQHESRKAGAREGNLALPLSVEYR